MVQGARCAARLLAALVLLALCAPRAGWSSAFCDCCCSAAAGTIAPCRGCDVDGSGTVTHDEVTLLGCANNPICAAAFPTPTPPSTPTMPACVGDCHGNGTVTVDDVLTMVNVAAGALNVLACQAGDADADGTITIDEILTAVGSAERGCLESTPTATVIATTSPPATLTAVPTDTPPPATATDTTTVPPSATPSLSRSATLTATVPVTVAASVTPTVSATPAPTCASVAESAAGGAAIVANGMAVIPSVITAIVSGVQFGNSAALGAAQGSGSCPQGGTASRTGSIPGTMMISLADCMLATSDGVLVLNGTATLSGFLTISLTANVQANIQDPSRTMTRLTTSANLIGTINPTPGGKCYVTAASLQLSSGTVSSQAANGGQVSVSFNNNASVAMSVAMFNQDCVPVDYWLTFNGRATLSGSTAGTSAVSSNSSFDVSFSDFTVSQNATTSPTQTEMNGSVSAPCFGGAVMIATRAALAQTAGVACPTGGTLRVSATATADVRYLAGGTVGIDTNLDGLNDETFASCLNAQLVGCQAQCMPTATVSATTMAVSPTPTAAPASATPTATSTITRTATPTAEPTATAIPSPSPSLTPPANAAVYCDSLSGPAIIPDNDPAGISNTITIPNSGVIADLNVMLDITHTYVGDLKVTLRHVDAGTMVTLLDRPGIPATTDGCNGHDLSCTFDDQAGRHAQTECRSAPPAIDGSVTPLGPLSSFGGQSVAGMWRLNVSDNAAQDVGSLFGWCLEVNSAAPVVTAYTCDGAEQCTLNIGDAFMQSFSFTAPGGNAVSWRIMAQRDDGVTFDAGAGTISPPSGSGTVPLSFNAFNCPQGSCRTTEYEYFLVVTDAFGADSPRARVHIVVLGNA